MRFEYSLTEMPKSQGHGQALVLEQRDADAIVNACSPALRAVFSFARCTAARISEVLNLRFENLTSAHVVLPKRICKGKKKTREVPINGRLAEEIRTWKYLFPGRSGDPKQMHLTRGAADKALRKVCAELGIIGASTHSWRRTSLTNANDAGVSLKVLSAISGHSSLDMLSRYLQTSEKQKQAACDAFG